jgi:DNA polymerase elongation subunit (family B)
MKWEAKDVVEGNFTNFVIKVWGLDTANQPVLVVIRDFLPRIWVELPEFFKSTRIKWNAVAVDEVYRQIANKVDYKDARSTIFNMQTDCRQMQVLQGVPIDTTLPDRNVAREKLLKGEYKKYPMMNIKLRILRNLYALNKLHEKTVIISGGRSILLRCWESDIPTYTKLQAELGITPCIWIDIPTTLPKVKMSNLVQEYEISYRGIQKVPVDIAKTIPICNAMLLTFDYETYSSNPLKFPNENLVSDKVFILGVCIERIGLPETRVLYAVVKGDIQKLPSERYKTANLIVEHDEIALLNWLPKLCNHYNPDIIIGHNILNFDFKYCKGRYDIFFQPRPNMSRLLNESLQEIKDARGKESAAMGQIKGMEVDIPGRMVLDTYRIVKRDYVLPQYNLSAVGQKFGLGGKDDVTPLQMFQAFEKAEGTKGKMNWVRTKELFDNLADNKERASTRRILEHRLQYLADIEVNDEAKVKAKYHEDLELVTDYCLRDCELTADIFLKLGIFLAGTSTANTAQISFDTVYNNGQQVRVVSQLYCDCYKKGIVITKRAPTDIPFVGGLVQKPRLNVASEANLKYEKEKSEDNLRDNVIVLDFKSLYPMILAAYNMCYTTYIPEKYWNLFPDPNWYWETPDVLCDQPMPDDFMDIDDEEQLERIKEKGKYFSAGDATVRKFRFLKAWVLRGVIPELVLGLVNKRDGIVGSARYKEMGKEKVKCVEYQILEKEQLAVKVQANSVYGFFGVRQNGRCPHIEIATGVTAFGRLSIGMVVLHIEQNYGDFMRIIYGDTDSVMVQILDMRGLTHDQWADRLCDEITALFPSPMKMKFEYWCRMLPLAKKKYLMLPMEKGAFVDLGGGMFKLEGKGVMSVKREYCAWAQREARAIAQLIMTRQSFAVTLRYVSLAIQRLLQGEIDIKEFIATKLYRGSYKNKSYPMKVFGDCMMRQSIAVEPGERLAYLVIHRPEAKLLGEKMMLVETYKNTEPKPQADFKYYLEKMFMNGVDQMFSTNYYRQVRFLDDMVHKDGVVRQIFRVYEAGGSIDDYVNSVITTLEQYQPDITYKNLLYGQEEWIQI